MKRVVLVRTLGPRNAGMVARVVANFGPAELVLVAPARPSLLVHPEFQQMSHGAEGVRAALRVVGTLGEALADCTSSIGFTARSRDSRWRADWRKLRDETARACDDPAQRVALVFGSEENGLTGEETDLCQTLCYLATSEEHTSLNLAVAVGVVLSSLYTARAAKPPESGPRLADHAALDYLRAHLKEVFAQVARSDAARRDIEGSIDRVFGRVAVESRDARAWHMMLRALGSRSTPMDLGVEPPTREARRRRAMERARERGRAPAEDAPPEPPPPEEPADGA